jgi:type IV pilus assembly protein PilM
MVETEKHREDATSRLLDLLRKRDDGVSPEEKVPEKPQIDTSVFDSKQKSINDSLFGQKEAASETVALPEEDKKSPEPEPEKAKPEAEASPAPTPPAKKSKLEELLSKLDEEMEKAGDDIIAPVSAKDENNDDIDMASDLSTLLKPETTHSTVVETEKAAEATESPRPKKNLADLLKNLDDATQDAEPELIGETKPESESDSAINLKENETPNTLASQVFSSQAQSPENLRPLSPAQEKSSVPPTVRKESKEKQIIEPYDYTNHFVEKGSDIEQYVVEWSAADFFRAVLFRRDNVVGIDFSDKIITFVEIKKRQDRFQIVNYGYTAVLDADLDGVSGDVRKRAEEPFEAVFGKFLSLANPKNKYVVYAIQSKNVVSRLLSLPPMSQKEVREAIKWNALKNLPFPEKYAVYDVSVAKSSDVTKKADYFIGIAHERTIAGAIARFKDANIIPRKIFSASFAVWQLFKTNYPEMQDQSVILLYIRDDVSDIVFIHEGQFQLNRQLSISSNDFTEALAQKVNTPEGEYNISMREAEKLKQMYGFPLSNDGITEFLNIDAFRLNILLRSAGERMVNEINRSIDFYRKTFSLPPIDSPLYIAGPGSAIPNLDSYLQRQINRPVHILNPLRSTLVDYDPLIEPIAPEHLSQFGLAIAAATETADHTNLAPKTIKSEEKYIPAYMIGLLLLLLTVLSITISSFAVTAQVEQATQTRNELQQKLNEVAPRGEKYADLIAYNNAALGVRNHLTLNRFRSNQVINMMKMAGAWAGQDIKLTTLAVEEQVLIPPGEKIGKPVRMLKLLGFVQSSSSMADLVLANFVIRLENAGFFINIKTDKNKRETLENGTMRLYFEINGQVKD